MLLILFNFTFALQNCYFCCIQAGTKCAWSYTVYKLLAFKTNFCRACSLTLNQPLLKLIFEVDSGGRGGGGGEDVWLGRGKMGMEVEDKEGEIKE